MAWRRADAALRVRRAAEVDAPRKGSMQVGSWVECLQRGQQPYMMAQVVSLSWSQVKSSKSKRRILSVWYEDGMVEKDIKSNARGNNGVDAQVQPIPPWT